MSTVCAAGWFLQCPRSADTSSKRPSVLFVMLVTLISSEAYISNIRQDSITLSEPSPNSCKSQVLWSRWPYNLISRRLPDIQFVILWSAVVQLIFHVFFSLVILFTRCQTWSGARTALFHDVYPMVQAADRPRSYCKRQVKSIRSSVMLKKATILEFSILIGQVFYDKNGLKRGQRSKIWSTPRKSGEIIKYPLNSTDCIHLIDLYYPICSI